MPLRPAGSAVFLELARSHSCSRRHGAGECFGDGGFVRPVVRRAIAPPQSRSRGRRGPRRRSTSEAVGTGVPKRPQRAAGYGHREPREHRGRQMPALACASTKARLSRRDPRDPVFAKLAHLAVDARRAGQGDRPACLLSRESRAASTSDRPRCAPCFASSAGKRAACPAQRGKHVSADDRIHPGAGGRLATASAIAAVRSGDAPAVAGDRFAQMRSSHGGPRHDRFRRRGVMPRGRSAVPRRQGSDHAPLAVIAFFQLDYSACCSRRECWPSKAIVPWIRSALLRSRECGRRLPARDQSRAQAGRSLTA